MTNQTGCHFPGCRLIAVDIQSSELYQASARDLGFGNVAVDVTELIRKERISLKEIKDFATLPPGQPVCINPLARERGFAFWTRQPKQFSPNLAIGYFCSPKMRIWKRRWDVTAARGAARPRVSDTYNHQAPVNSEVPGITWQANGIPLHSRENRSGHYSEWG